MGKKELTFTSKFLLTLASGYELMPALLSNPHQWRKWSMFGFKNPSSAYGAVYQLYKKGLIKYVDKNNEKFIRLTKKGQIKALLAKAGIAQVQKWDGKWRLFIFDIPESSRTERNRLRNLLKKNGYYKLQASVFVSPYPLNREAISYLKQTGLIEYIRILRVDEIDDDKDLKKRFNLK